MSPSIIFKMWFPLATAIFFLTGLVYIAVQQDIRQSANDPQIGMAEDIAGALTNGESPSDFDNQNKIDVAKSLSPYVMIYDTQGLPVAGTGILSGKIPNLPGGVFVSTLSLGEDRVTWQPKPGVRSALVVVPYQGGFVAVGRSLREIEIREDNLFVMALLSGVITLIATFAVSLIANRKEEL